MSTHVGLRHLPDLYPSCGPWTTAALLHGFDEQLAIPSSDLPAELSLIRRQKLSPVLLHLLNAERPGWSGDGVAELRRDAVARVARSRSVAVTGRDVVAELSASGIPAVVTKGSGIAAHYRWPRVRTSTDVDLLVEPARFSAAFDLLTRDRWGELTRSLQPWPAFHRWCREAANLVATNGDCVDLHHRPSPWVWARHLDFATVSAAGVETDGVLTACGADNLAIAALQLIGDHAAPGTKLIAWRDIAELGRSLDPVEATSRLVETRTAGVVRWLISQLPPAMRPERLLAELPVTPPERTLRLDAMLRTARGKHPMASHAVRIPLANAVAFLAGSAVPSRGFRERRRRTAVPPEAGAAARATTGEDRPHG